MRDLFFFKKKLKKLNDESETKYEYFTKTFSAKALSMVKSDEY